MKLSREYVKINCKKIGNWFLADNKKLTSIELPLVEKIGDWFLPDNTKLTSIELPMVEEVGNCFLYRNKNPQIDEIKQRIIKGKLPEYVLYKTGVDFDRCGS